MLTDHVTITVTAGHGGAGVVAYSKIKMTLGPTGGSGGRGADIILEAVADLGALRRYKTQKVFRAPDGRDGRGAFRDGHDGDALILNVPRGTVATLQPSGESYELTDVGMRVCIAQGGRGGKGNFLYRSATNISPQQAQLGLPGEHTALELELKLIADIGLIGLPNVGKSSLLNEVTNATSRVANYPFTTLEPHLGAYYDLILADIPGLIEGAATGKGLGTKFLRHVERTRVLLHCITATTEDALADYHTIRTELGAHNPLLLEKQEYVLITKTDLVDEERVAELTKALVSTGREVLPLSIHDADRMATFEALLRRIADATIRPTIAEPTVDAE